MIRHQIDLQIDRPVEEVFAFVTNSDNHAKWDPLSVEMRQQEDGTWRKGMKFREIRKLNGRNTEIFSQVAIFEPNQRMEIQSLTGPDFHGTWVFEPSGQGTHLWYQAEMKMTGVGRLLEPLIAKSFKQQLETNFANLKRVIESGV
jgi:uncharacterized protein YndB with AHSA1/START domain